jgi:hypothetical protein
MQVIRTASDSEIVEMTNSLLQSFGNCKWIDPDTYNDLVDIFNVKKDLIGCIEAIKKHFRFEENKLAVTFFRDTNSKKYFDRVSEKKPAAAILIRENMPLYGTSDFKRMPITMSINENCIYETLPPFLYMISHELSHLVLHSTGNKFKHSEIATDILAAIMIGPGNMSAGRGNFGYIRDDHFDIVKKIIYAKSKKLSVNKLKNGLWYLFNKQRLSK